MAHEKSLIGSLTPLGQTMEVTSSQKVPVGTGFLTISAHPEPPVADEQFLTGSLVPLG